MARERVVVNANVLVSRLLLARSVAASAVRKAVDHGQLLASEATLEELSEVLSRWSLNLYVSIKDRGRNSFGCSAASWNWCRSPCASRPARDPKDGKFLELAVNGSADAIVTGDKDLLVLDRLRGISIIRPARYHRALISSQKPSRECSADSVQRMQSGGAQPIAFWSRHSAATRSARLSTAIDPARCVKSSGNQAMPAHANAGQKSWHSQLSGC
jgi:putative PIN family toxin of toxin-antitoxin system